MPGPLALNDGVGQATAQSIFLSGRTNSEVRKWLGGRLDKLNVDPRDLDASSLEIPAHAIARGAPCNAIASADALAELAAWVANAEILLSQIQKQLMGRRLTTSPVCCWPHHFDLATLTTLPNHTADANGYVGIRLSPGDEYDDEPYFYVSVYPKPDPSMLPTLPMFGHSGICTNSWPLLHWLIRCSRQRIKRPRPMNFCGVRLMPHSKY